VWDESAQTAGQVNSSKPAVGSFAQYCVGNGSAYA